MAEIRDEDRTDWRWEDWDRQGRKADFVPAFRDWRFDWLDVPRLFGGSETVFEFPMADRDPVAQWSFGRVTLLGDAAHPMYPSGSNGAAQAILDARALTRAVEGQPDIRDALRVYEAERLGPSSDVVLQNRAFAAERVLRLVDERCPPPLRQHPRLCRPRGNGGDFPSLPADRRLRQKRGQRSAVRRIRFHTATGH